MLTDTVHSHGVGRGEGLGVGIFPLMSIGDRGDGTQLGETVTSTGTGVGSRVLQTST